MRQTIRFDNRALFASGEHRLTVGSWQRQSIERGFAGLDGAFSIDLGKKKRQLEQHGELVAGSRRALRDLTTEISSYVDGCVHDLMDGEGNTYPSVRMDRFRVLNTGSGGNQARCSYDVIYTQLGE